ncbi:MAG: M56 family metallopeptidase [Planctomycetaceae bacterium]
MNRLISVLTALGGLVMFPLVDLAIKGTIVLVLAGSACFVLRRDSAATRHFVWSTAMGLLLAMPILSLVLPAWRILPAWLHSNGPAVATAPSTFVSSNEALSPVTITRPDSVLLPWQADERLVSDMGPLPGRSAVQDNERDTQIRPTEIEDRRVLTGHSLISWTTWLSGVWFAGCVLLAARLAVASVLLRRSARRSVLVESFPGERQGVSPPCLSRMPDRRICADDVADQHPRLAPCGSKGSEAQEVRLTGTRRADAQPLAEVQRLKSALADAKSVLGVTRPVQMMLDPHRSIPVVWGLWKTRLQLPAKAISWSDEQLRSVLLHELAHVRRQDLFVLALTQLACALYWFNPLVWLAAWRLHVERERACDDLVLASGVRASAYAEHLLNVATQLNSSRWTHACGLAMARNSSLHGRLTAVLSEKQNRRRMTTLITCVSLMIVGAISVPIAMLQAASVQSDEKELADSKQPTSPPAVGEIDGSEDWGNNPNLPVYALCSESEIWFREQHLEWSEPVNGLRAAISIRPTAADGNYGKERRVLLVIQNVSDQPIRFCDTAIQETDTPAADVEGRKLYLQDNGEILSGIQNAKSSKTDHVFQPRQMLSIDMLDMGNDQGHNRGDSLAEGIIKDSGRALFAVLNIAHAPEGAWTGKLTTPATRGAYAANAPLPRSKEGQALFRYCIDHARLNGDIPGGLISRLHDLVQEFIELNSGDQYGDAYAKKMQPLVTRFEHKGDWKQEEVAKLFDDIAAVTAIPLERTMNAIRENSLQRGLPIPASMSNLNWGETMPGGLRMAWVVEPRAEKYHRSSALKSRVILHNSGNKPVMFVTRSFHQPQHKAVTVDGITVPIESTFWTTIGRPEPYRLHPGEYCEVYAPGIGIGPQNKDIEDWSNVRAGSWILADEDDDIIFRPGEILLTGDHAENIDPDWWLKFIAERIRRETPLPAYSKERDVIMFRVISDLFGNSPTPEEAAGFLADNSPQAIENLAKVLSGRTWHTSVAGPISSGEIKFHVLPEDPEAATRPRITTNPGRYNLGEEVRFVVSRRPIGETLVNEADLIWYPPGKDNVPTKVSLPNGYDTWAAGWLPGTTILWVSQTGLLRSYDFTDNAAVKETRYEGDQIVTAPIPAALDAALRAAIVATENGKEQPRRPVGTPAAMKDENAAIEKPKHEATASLISKWQRFARTDGRIPGSVLGTVRSRIEDFLNQYPKDDATPALTELLPSYDVSHDWEPADVIALLDKTADLHTAPLGWADLPLEFGDMRRVRSGTPLPESLSKVAWGAPAENGLRVAWLLEPPAESYALGTVLKSRVLLHNSGQSPIMFLTETWHQDDRHQARDAAGQEIKVASTWYSGITPMATFRLEPGNYVEMQGHGIGIGAGEYREERSTGAVGASIEATVGTEVHFTTTVRFDQHGWTRPDDPKDPVELRKVNVAERVALESPLPSSAADRTQLITRVTNEIFGEDPTDAEVNDFLNDTSPEALTNLTVQLQKREYLPLFRGTLATGETIFKVLPVDPTAATKPRRAIGPGRYVLSDSVHLAVQQVTSVERFGAPEVRTNSAKILFLSPDPKVASPHPPYEIRLPDGLANYAILWTRNSGQLFVVEPGSVRTIDFANPADVKKSQSKLNVAPEYRALIPESLQRDLD